MQFFALNRVHSHWIILMVWKFLWSSLPVDPDSVEHCQKTHYNQRVLKGWIAACWREQHKLSEEFVSSWKWWERQWKRSWDNIRWSNSEAVQLWHWRSKRRVKKKHSYSKADTCRSPLNGPFELIFGAKRRRNQERLNISNISVGMPMRKLTNQAGCGNVVGKISQWEGKIILEDRLGKFKKLIHSLFC